MANEAILNTVIQGDCLVESGKIASGSVDLILTDLPYGTMKNAPSTWDADKTKWDTAIEPKDVYAVANRILRKNGKMVLFSQEPYTSRLITEATANVPFSYRMVWEKDTFANHLGAKKAPVGYYEDILVFTKYEEDKKGHPLQEYFLSELKETGLTVKEICNNLGTTHASHFFTRGKQFRVPNETYLKRLQDLTGRFQIKHQTIKEMQERFLMEDRVNYPSTFNLWEGGKYKSNILRYKKDYNGYHPTQKPVLLLEDLIKTFSNEGDTVVDLTAGSGSTAVAAINSGRNFVAIEREVEYVAIANQRISDARDAISV